MIIYQCVDSIVGELLDQTLNTVEIVLVILACSLFYGFPHNAEADDFDAPVLHVLEIFGYHGGEGVEFVSGGEVGG